MRKQWFENLTLKDRLQVQKFVLLLYTMEANDGKNR